MEGVSDNRVRTTDSYDRVVRKHKSSETIKITNGVCGSNHTLYSGFVFSPKLDARRQYWVGLKASDQVKSLTSSEARYVQTDAHKHKTRVEVRVSNLDRSNQETLQTYDLSGGEGIKYVFFDINQVGHYTVIVENLATGNCDGGKCEDGTSDIITADVNLLGGSSNFVSRKTTTISNCWYKKVIMSFDITQEELDKLKGGEDIDIVDINNQLDGLNGGGDGGEPADNTAEMILFGGLGLSAILLFINFLKS